MGSRLTSEALVSLCVGKNQISQEKEQITSYFRQEKETGENLSCI